MASYICETVIMAYRGTRGESHIERLNVVLNGRMGQYVRYLAYLACTMTFGSADNWMAEESTPFRPARKRFADQTTNINSLQLSTSTARGSKHANIRNFQNRPVMHAH